MQLLQIKHWVISWCQTVKILSHEACASYLRAVPKCHSAAMPVGLWSRQTQHVRSVSTQRQGRMAGHAPHIRASLTTSPMLILQQYSRLLLLRTGWTRLAEAKSKRRNCLHGNKTHTTILLGTRRLPIAATQKMARQVTLQLVYNRGQSSGVLHLVFDLTFDLHPLSQMQTIF
jgi:hypothetical protein